MEKLTGHKRYLFLSAVIIALGITLTAILKDNIAVIGIIFIAIGGFYFIAGMSRKKKEIEKEKNIKNQ